MGYWDELNSYTNVNVLVGKTLSDVKVDKGQGWLSQDEIRFYCTDGTEYLMCHDQDCCESVTINDINGELIDLVGSPITLAEEYSNSGSEDYGTFTWTFYKFGTVKGYVDLRWYGSSNGYYSESVSFKEIKKEN